MSQIESTIHPAYTEVVSITFNWHYVQENSNGEWGESQSTISVGSRGVTRITDQRKHGRGFLIESENNGNPVEQHNINSVTYSSGFLV
ncbi:MAG: hypothetical protein ACJAYB_000107 [Psychromonas sp.]|jgi:hypothetical protein